MWYENESEKKTDTNGRAFLRMSVFRSLQCGWGKAGNEHARADKGGSEHAGANEGSSEHAGTDEGADGDAESNEHAEADAGADQGTGAAYECHL